MKIKSIIIVLLISISFTNWNCGPVSELIHDQDINEFYELSGDKYDVSPFEIVILSTDEYVFIEESYTGVVESKEIEVIRISDNQLSLMIPYLEEGEKTLYLAFDDVELTYDFYLIAPEIINNPDEIITTYKNNVVDAFNELKDLNQQYNLEIEPQNIQVIEKYISDFNNAYTSASAEEKQELAQFMNANPDLFDFSNFDYSFFNDSLNTRDFVNWDKRLTEDMRYFTGLVIATGATVVLFNGALATLNPIAIGITGAALLTEVVLLKSQTKTILNRSYKPFEFDIQNELRATTVEFENETEYQLGIDATYRTLYKDDQSSSDLAIELVANINTVTHYWNQVLDNIPGTTGSVKNLSDQNNYQINSSRSSVTPEYISIENISNSSVQLMSFSNNNNMIKVKFKTSSGSDQNFTFNIIYNNPDFCQEIITVNAKIIVPVFDFQGSWLVSYYTADMTTGVEYLHQQERFTCNSAGYAQTSEVRFPNAPNNDWQPAGEVSLSFYDWQIAINVFSVQVNNVDDNIFYSSNWNTNYNVGDYYWKIKLEK